MVVAVDAAVQHLLASVNPRGRHRKRPRVGRARPVPWFIQASADDREVKVSRPHHGGHRESRRTPQSNQQLQQGVWTMQGNDVAAVLDEVSGQFVGDGVELVFQDGAHCHGRHCQSGRADSLRRLHCAVRQGPVVGERTAQRAVTRVRADERVPDGEGNPVAERDVPSLLGSATSRAGIGSAERRAWRQTADCGGCQGGGRRANQVRCQWRPAESASPTPPGPGVTR